MTPQAIAQIDTAMLITIFEIIIYSLFDKKVSINATIKTKTGGNITTLTDRTQMGQGQVIKIKVETNMRQSFPKTLARLFLTSNRLRVCMFWSPDNWLSIEGKSRHIKTIDSETVVLVNNGLEIKAFSVMSSGFALGKAIDDECYIRILDKDAWREGTINWELKYIGNKFTKLLTKLFVLIFVKLQFEDHKIKYVEV